MRSLKMIGLSSLILVLLFATACSSVPSDSKPSIEEKKEAKGEEEIQEPATDVGGMLKEGPGKFAGKAYDEQKVQKALDQLPDNLSGKDAYKHLLSLLAEDYQPTVKKLDEFDTSFELDGETPDGVKGPNGEKAEKPLHVSILLDASGSMAGAVDGGVKMDLAKAAVARFASSLPENAKVSLQVYGHKGSNAKKDKSVSCKSAEEVYPLGDYQEKKFNQSLDRFRPTGWTPLAAAMKKAREDLQQSTEAEATNLVYIVSDGVETCGGDPVAEAQKLNKSNIQAVVNIIGFDVDDAGQRALKEAAKAGGGEYATADSEKDLRSYFDSQHTKLRIAWSNWGTENRLDVSSQFDEKIAQLKKLADTAVGRFYSQITQEKSNLDDAIDHLDEKGKMQDGAKWEAKELARVRDRKLTKYRRTRYYELRSALEKNRDTLKDQITKKSSEMRKKYE